MVDMRPAHVRTAAAKLSQERTKLRQELAQLSNDLLVERLIAAYELANRHTVEEAVIVLELPTDRQR